ncbi:MAG TPA: Omp28-related outer membrane protein [Ignavibacteriaceae bacterium]|nr:Omp28-related outer membrane protein [Ignavibacteriaceae bacterium]
MSKFLRLTFFIILFTLIGNFTSAQTERNPLIEFCTGTWCQWCPCGDYTIEQLLIAHPNLIPLAYHGPVGQDPYSVFPGNEIINLMGYSGYPTATVDRSSGLGDYTTWTGKVNNRINVPATVTIDIERGFDQSTGELNATVNMTPLQDLAGQFKYNIVLTEDSLIYNQVNNGQCVSGGPNWVHYWVVRAMINGASGENVNDGGTWSTGDMISKSVTYTIPATYNPDKCNLIVFVYKQNSPLYMAEVQQAMQWTLIAPDYVASAATTSPDVIADRNTAAEFNMVIRNQGLLTDKYDIGVNSTAPSTWGIQFTTVNGTFDMGQTDSVEVASGDSTLVTVTVNPNGTDGSAVTFMEFASRINPSNHGHAMARNITTMGAYGLVVDATNNKYVSYLDSSMQDVFGETYGIVSRNALDQEGVDLSHFYLMTWSQGTSLPAFHPNEVTALQSFLDNGGNLFITGQDIGSDIFEPTGQSQFAQDFYHNYLHAGYVADASNIFLMKGVPGDLIGNGLQFVPSFIYDKSLEVITRYDSYADSVFTYLNGPSIGGIRSDNSTSRVVYLGFGIEQIADKALRDTIVARSFGWLTENVVVNTEGTKNIPYTFSLDQNYPNPFNPSTKITYAISKTSHTTLKIFDVLGNEVTTLVNGEKQAGKYEVEFNASDLSSGVYFYQLQSGGLMQTRKMVVLK